MSGIARRDFLGKALASLAGLAAGGPLLAGLKMNCISTKMPDGHWLTEARLKGTQVVTVACEYQSTSNKADRVIVVRPGSDPALALGLAHVILQERLFDAQYVRGHTDLPLLIRMDTLKLLPPEEVFPNYRPAELKNLQVIPAGQKPPPAMKQRQQVTKNVGFHGGNIGSYSGNYRGAYFNGLPLYNTEDPFDIALDPGKPVHTRYCYKGESAHYYNYGDRPLRVGNKLFTGKTHLPTPTKFAPMR